MGFFFLNSSISVQIEGPFTRAIQEGLTGSTSLELLSNIIEVGKNFSLQIYHLDSETCRLSKLSL